MEDFINKVRRFETLFIYNFSTYDKKTNSLKIYYFSPDQQHQYLSLDLGKNNLGLYQCEIGGLFLGNNDIFEDTPIQVFYISKKNKEDLRRFSDNHPEWNYHLINEIKDSFRAENLTF